MNDLRLLNADESKMFQRASLFFFFKLRHAFVHTVHSLPWLQPWVLFYFFCGESSLRCACQAVSLPVSVSLLLKRWWVIKISCQSKKKKKYIFHFSVNPKGKKTTTSRKPWTWSKEQEAENDISDSFKVKVTSSCRTWFWPFHVKDIVGEVRLVIGPLLRSWCRSIFYFTLSPHLVTIKRAISLLLLQPTQSIFR